MAFLFSLTTDVSGRRDKIEDQLSEMYDGKFQQKKKVNCRSMTVFRLYGDIKFLEKSGC